MKIKVYDIQWDTDNDEDILEVLPTELDINADELPEDIEISDAISDWLSDSYGFCHFGFKCSVVQEGFECSVVQEKPKTRKVRIAVKETRVLTADVEVSEEEYLALQGDGDDTPTLDEMYRDVVDSKYAESEYDYFLYDYETDKVIVDFDD